MSKQEIRAEQLLKRKNLSENLYFELSQKIADQFFLNFHHKLLQTKTLHLFLPIEKNHEPNTNFILKTLQQRFKKTEIAIPKTDFESQELIHFLIDDTTEFQENKYGIPEPIAGELIEESKIDLVLVPLLAFDQYGHRIGYGGGFYDRFLAKVRPDCIKIGLSFFEPITFDFEPDQTDQRLNFCITPNKIWSFSN